MRPVRPDASRSVNVRVLRAQPLIHADRRRRTSLESRTESPLGRVGSPTETSSSGARTGSDRSIAASISVKIAVFAPMPSASDSTAMAVNPGLRRSMRTP